MVGFTDPDVHSSSAGTVFRRRNLTSKDAPRRDGIKNKYNGHDP